MSEASQRQAKPTIGLGFRVYLLGLRVCLLAGLVVAPLAGIGAYVGRRLAGDLGYWVGCYLVAVVVAALAGWLFARLFRAHPLYWVFGALGQLLFAHWMWFALSGDKRDALPSGDVQWIVVGAVVGAAGLVGTFLGFAAAYPLVKFGARKVPTEPGGAPDGGRI